MGVRAASRGGGGAPLSVARLMCVSPSYFFLLLLVLGGAGQAYEVAELVEGVVEAEAVNHYTVDVTGVVVGRCR